MMDNIFPQEMTLPNGGKGKLIGEWEDQNGYYVESSCPNRMVWLHTPVNGRTIKIGDEINFRLHFHRKQYLGRLFAMEV